MKLLTVKETAVILSVAEKTLYEWAELNKIPHLKLNGCLRFEYDELMRWINNCKKGPWTKYNIDTQIVASAPKGGAN